MKKIMFNDLYSLTREVLAGRKTMTRRSEYRVKINNATEKDVNAVLSYLHHSNSNRILYEVDGKYIEISTNFKIGEEVAVAQSYKDILGSGCLTADKEKKIRELMERKHPGCFNKLFVDAELMPHHIVITGIKIERLQSISEEDCFKEGVRLIETGHFYFPGKNDFGLYFNNLHDAFAGLIDRVSGKGTWKSNPWVVAYEFRLKD